MKRLVLIFLLLFAVQAWGAETTFEWDAVDRAEGYKIYMSIDNGATWDGGMDVGSVLEYKYTDIPDSGLILFRVAAYNATGEAVRTEFGTWYNGDWKPLEAISGIRVGMPK